MADETTATAPTDAPAPTVAAEPTEPTTTIGETDDSVEKPEEKETTTEHATVDASVVEGDKVEQTDAAPADPASDDTPGSSGKDKKRKSVGGVPEHKSKKLSKKKSMPTLRLECKPGEFYWARLKGFPPWPAVICDEEMLPESLLASRPVSTARPDGNIRDDFKEGGKNAKERTFPIMFLYTNEFQWMVNTSLTPLDPEECKVLPKGKMPKNLSNAYQIVSENHDLDYFKGILRQWQEEQEAFRQMEEEEAAAEAERQKLEAAALEAAAAEDKDKPKKKAARKSKAADEDVEMDGVEAPKSSKKRKKDVDSDADVKPKKTPKVTKINAPKTPNGEEASAKKSTKTKKKVVSAPKIEDEDESKPQLTEEEKLAQREKAVLYLRHRLQKGFLSRETAPQETEMAAMAEFFSQLEAYENLETSIIRTTKIHKVLKAIVKLASVPREEEFQFKKRSSALLEVWNRRMEADGEAAPPSAIEKKQEPVTNGDAATPTVESSEAAPPQPQIEEAKEEAPAAVEKPADIEAEDNADKVEETTNSKTEAAVEKQAELRNGVDVDGDVAMQTSTELATA